MSRDNQTAKELRQRAAEIRVAAQRAERMRYARAELEYAAQLEAEADRLEGKVSRPKQATTALPQEEIQRLRNERIAAAIEKMLQIQGLKP